MLKNGKVCNQEFFSYALTQRTQSLLFLVHCYVTFYVFYDIQQSIKPGQCNA